MERRTARYGGRELTYLFQPAGQEAPLAVCLAVSEEEAAQCLRVLKEAQQGTALAAVVVPGGRLEECEEAVTDLVFDWRSAPEVCSARISLTGSPACAGAVWRLASHVPAWFAAVCVIEGRGDPYAVRSLAPLPLRVCLLSGREESGSALPAGARRLAAGLRIAGAQQTECRLLAEGVTAETAFAAVFADGEALRWMTRQDIRLRFTVTFLRPGVWCVEDYFTSCCYLVEGSERALLIDTGMGEGDLLGLVRSLTPLPVELAITHPHGDHMRHIDRFDRVYLHSGDVRALQETPEQFPDAYAPGSTARPELVPLEEGSRIELGGGVALLAAELSGHTERCLVFRDDAHRLLFTGDAVGSGFIALMICRESELYEVINRYEQNLSAFARRHLEEVRSYGWLGGHKIQENGCDERRQQSYLANESVYFNPLRAEVLLDMQRLCRDILNGIVTKEDLLSTEEHYCSHGTAGMYFRFV